MFYRFEGGRLEETYKLATLSKSYMDFVKVIIWKFRKLDAIQNLEYIEN
jgi:hypothetical protein